MQDTTPSGTQITCLSCDEIRVLRKRLGLTQAGLAKRLCVERNTVARYEMGTFIPSRPVQLILLQLTKDVRVAPKNNTASSRAVLTEEILAIVTKAVAEYRSAKSTREAISSATGVLIPERTIGRRMAELRRQRRAKEIAVESSVAIAACGDDALALSKLAASIVLERGWCERRIESLDKSFQLFLKEPSPKNMTVLRVEAMAFVLETQLSRHLSFPLDRGEPARVDAARTESTTSVLPVAARVNEAPQTEGSNTK